MSFKRLLVAGVAFAAAFPATGQSGPLPQMWAIDPRPIFDVGAESDDSMLTFSKVTGVARTPTGEIVVADLNDYGLRYFSPAGKFLRTAGRRGEGPGEFRFVLRMLHCGDSLFVMDLSGKWSVFSAAGRFKRVVSMKSLRIQSTAGPRLVNGGTEPPYAMRCNSGGQFIGQGWERATETRPGAFRALVPFWLSTGQGTITSRLGAFAGPERWASTNSEGMILGDRPLPLGRQPALAIGRSRAYIGTADSFVIMVFGLDGKPTGTIHKIVPAVRTTRADIKRFVAIDTSGLDPRLLIGHLRDFEQIKWPATLPAYASLVVDSEDNLWVQRYPRGGETTSPWVIFSANGTEIAQAVLPANLLVYEIGKDYVLGVMPEPPDGVHHVEMFRLIRGSRS